MKTTPNCVADWQATIAKLEQDLAALTERNETVRRDRRELSLSVALGNEAARQAAEQLELTGAGLTLEIRNTTEAIESARAGLRASQEAVRDAEREVRAKALAEALEARHEAAKRVDAALEGMATALLSWLDTGDAITDRGGDGHQKQARGQLGAAIWFALAQAGANRSESWKFRTIADNFSGSDRPSPARWRPLADNP